jgi:hypothetical protein
LPVWFRGRLRQIGRHRHGGDEVERFALLTDRLYLAQRQTHGRLGMVTDETLVALRALSDDDITTFNQAASAALREVRQAETDRDALLAIFEAMHVAVKIHMRDGSNGHPLLTAERDD